MSSERSAWVYVGVGCGVLALLVVLVVVVGGFLAFRGVKKLEAEMTDPVARAEKVKRVLGAEELPAGYHAMVAFSIPFVMEVALLSDESPDDDGQVHSFGEHGVIYLKMFNIGQDEQELRDFFEGRTDDPSVLRRNNISIDVDEILARGTFTADPATAMYVSQRGGVSTHGYSGRGLTSVVLIDCPDDRRTRTLIWFGPDPSPDAPIGKIDVSGTTADPAAIAELMSGFRLCG